MGIGSIATLDYATDRDGIGKKAHLVPFKARGNGLNICLNIRSNLLNSDVETRVCSPLSTLSTVLNRRESCSNLFESCSNLLNSDVETRVCSPLSPLSTVLKHGICDSRYWHKLIFCRHGAEIWVRASFAWTHG